MGRKGVSKRKSATKKNAAVPAGGKGSGAVSNLTRAAEPVVTQSIGRGEAVTSRKNGAKK
jgi:hypothetical protein